MVFASQRWLGVRLDCLSALLTAATALASVIVSQDAGNYTCICNQQINPCLYEPLNFLEHMNRMASYLEPLGVKRKLTYVIIFHSVIIAWPSVIDRNIWLPKWAR